MFAGYKNTENLCYVHTVLPKEAEGGEGVGRGERGGGGEREREIENVSTTSKFFLKSLQLLDAATIQTRRKSAIVFVKYFPKSKISKSCFHTLI